MITNFNWYKFTPVDTLFFRGAEPMIMGESHTSNFIFPPQINTIEGAIRTYLYKKDRKKYSDIIKIGEAHGDFEIIGPFFLKNEELFIPAPYTWFIDKNKLRFSNGIATSKIFKIKEINSALIKLPSNTIYWVKGDSNELISIGGNWIKISDFCSNNNEIKIYNGNYFYDLEPRVGIALKNRKVRQGHIYSFTHIRLKNDVSIVFGISYKLPEDKGILTLGAEKRFGKFEKIDLDFNLKFQGDFYMILSLIPEEKNISQKVVATGKVIYLGGWDLHKGFHKPMIGYYPAGSVFKEKLKNTIAIQ